MGDDKTQLQLHDRFGFVVAAGVLAELIAAAEADSPGPIAVRVEVDAANEFDDVVATLVGADQQQREQRWQVKDQSTAIQATMMGDILKDVAKTLTGNAQALEFVVGVRDLVQVGKTSDGLHLRVLQRLCETAKQTGANAEEVCAPTQQDQKRWIEFIRAHSGVSSTDDLFKLLAKIQIRQLVGPEAIKDAAKNRLARSFVSPDDLFDRLVELVAKFPDQRITFDYDKVRQDVLSNGVARTPGNLPWVRISRVEGGMSWEARGTSPESQWTDHCWREGVLLKVDGRPAVGDDLDRALLRLLSHRNGRSVLHFNEPAAWDDLIRQRTGGTLGLDPTSPSSLSSVSQGCSSPTPPGGMPRFPRAANTIAATLTKSMDASSWTQVSEGVAESLQTPKQPIEADLLATMRAIWSEWHKAQDADEILRRHFLERMLTTPIEWADSRHDNSLRCGPQTTKLVVRAIFFALAIAAALQKRNLAVSPSNFDAAANLLVGSSRALLVGLASASVPGPHSPLSIDQAAAYFADQCEGFLLLPFSQTAPATLAAYVKASRSSFASSHQGAPRFNANWVPPPVLTAELPFHEALQKGAEAIQDLVRSALARQIEDEWSPLFNALIAEPSATAKNERNEATR